MTYSSLSGSQNKSPQSSSEEFKCQAIPGPIVSGATGQSSPGGAGKRPGTGVAGFCKGSGREVARSSRVALGGAADGATFGSAVVLTKDDAEAGTTLTGISDRTTWAVVVQLLTPIGARPLTSGAHGWLQGSGGWCSRSSSGGNLRGSASWNRSSVCSRSATFTVEVHSWPRMAN